MSPLHTRHKLSSASEHSSRSISNNSQTKLKINTHHKSEAISADILSDRATLSFVRRTLCSQLGVKARSVSGSIDEILPPLTSSNEVDLQLYGIIAILIREFIQTWYHKITTDQIFVEELVKIIAHCTRAIEQRLRKVDLESLLFDEIPELLEAHIQAFQLSHVPLHPPPFEQDSRNIYHTLWPLPALAPIPRDHDKASLYHQEKKESAYRELLVQGVLTILLPTEDLENECLSSLLSQILSELVLGKSIAAKASEPWLIWEGITKFAEVLRLQILDPNPKGLTDQPAPNASDSIPLEIARERKFFVQIHRSLEKFFGLFLHYSFMFFTTVRIFINIYVASKAMTYRRRGSISVLDYQKPHNEQNYSVCHQSLKKPLLTMKFWSCCAKLLDIETRMPWVKGSLSMLQWVALTGPGKLGMTDGIIDNVLPGLLRTARANMFPNNMIAPVRIEPDAAHCLVIRRRCAESILLLIPPDLRNLYFGAGWDDMVRELEEGLCIFQDSYCNKHLLYSLLELILVRLLPELSDSGIEELSKERLN